MYDFYFQCLLFASIPVAIIVSDSCYLEFYSGYNKVQKLLRGKFILLDFKFEHALSKYFIYCATICKPSY